MVLQPRLGLTGKHLRGGKVISRSRYLEFLSGDFADATLGNALIRFTSSPSATARVGARDARVRPYGVIVMRGRRSRDVAYQNTYFRLLSLHANEILALQRRFGTLEITVTRFSNSALGRLKRQRSLEGFSSINLFPRSRYSAEKFCGKDL